MLKAKDLRDQSQEDLQYLEKDLLKEIFNLNNELHVARKLEKPHLLRIKKRDRARVLTVLRQKSKDNS